MDRYCKAILPLTSCFEQRNHEVVGEFYSQDRHYWIVWIVNIEDCAPEQLSATTGSTRYCNSSDSKEHGQLNINGYTYVVIEDEQNSHCIDEDIPCLLSSRELQIATLVALGQANKQIARELQISEWTVSTYLRRIFAKLGVDSRAAMVYHCASLLQRHAGWSDRRARRSPIDAEEESPIQ
jgi:DNA-binding CsgD family transcriptional regulator